jgi:NAD(P)-dependent dehydrogenase (short-subunit alcohol dehydrogenase family)
MASGGLLDERVVLISGGTSGLGAAIARAAAREGALVVVTGRRRELGEALVAELSAAGNERAESRAAGSGAAGGETVARDAGGSGAAGSGAAGSRALFVPADVAEVEQARGCVTAAVAAFGRVDGLVNAAGLTTRGTLLDTTPELFDEHVAVNLKAPFFLMQAVVADMVARKAPGTIVNVITTSEHGGQPYLAPYVAAKAGLAGLTRNAAHAHRWDRIRINGLNIGWTDTEGEDATQRRFHGAGDDWREKAGASLPMGKLGQPDEIADFVVFLLSDRSGVVTGSVIDWDQNVLGAFD